MSNRYTISVTGEDKRVLYLHKDSSENFTYKESFDNAAFWTSLNEARLFNVKFLKSKGTIKKLSPK